MDGGELIAQVLKKQGVRFIFTLSGGHISPILVGAKNQGIRVIDVRQESTAVFAADAVGRLTGIPGVAVVTAGPGVTNSITAIKNAQMANSPLILLGGAAATILKGRGALQDIEQIKLFKTSVKWATTIKRYCDIIEVIEEAFDVAKSGIPGPVFVECPIDLLYDEALVRGWYGAFIREAKTSEDKAIDLYLRTHVDQLFTCSDKNLNPSDPKAIKPFSVDQEKISQTISYLSVSKAPILVLGSQVMFRTDEVNNLAKAVEKLGIPVYLTGMARGLLGDVNPINFRHKRSVALKDADLIILAGMELDFRLNYGRALNPKAVYISINRSTEALKKNLKPTLGIQTDPSTFLVALSEKFSSIKMNWKDWIYELHNREEKRENEIQKFTNLETEYINPLFLCKEINKVLDDDSIIIGDGGDFVATASYIVKPKGPLSWLDPGPFGTLGVGAGFALAAKLIRPESEVWLIYGDGAAGYSIVELDTFVRHNIPIIAVIGNDAGWTQISREQVEYLKDDVGTV
ncbi:MAG: thiamine pyrophosphate-binding protein, partial [Promethearchaeota archaeon]